MHILKWNRFERKLSGLCLDLIDNMTDGNVKIGQGFFENSQEKVTFLDENILDRTFHVDFFQIIIITTMHNLALLCILYLHVDIAGSGDPRCK